MRDGREARSRVLVLRSGGEPGDAPPGATVVVTHEIVPDAEGIGEALAFDPRGAALAVSSRTTVRVLVSRGVASLLAGPFALVVAAGPESADALVGVGAAPPLVPDRPGAPGIARVLSTRRDIRRILWPRGADATLPSVEALDGRVLDAPVVYVKRPARVPDAVLAAFRSRAFDAVAVGSLAALDVFLAAAGSGVPMSGIRWGVLGPETARALQARGLPAPLVPEAPRLAELVRLLSA